MFRRVLISALAGLACAPLAAHAASPMLQVLSRGAASDELLTYDPSQDGLPGFTGYQPVAIARLGTEVEPPGSLNSVAVSGTNLYALGAQATSNQLLTYDLKQSASPTFSGYQPDAFAQVGTDQLPSSSVVSITVSGASLYALSRGPSFVELLQYDLTQANLPNFMGYQPIGIASLGTDLQSSSSFVSIAVSGTYLYALSRGATSDELLTYDLTQEDRPNFTGFQPIGIASLGTDLLPAGSFVSIAVSGTTLYALSQGASVDELLKYDLTQEDRPNFTGFQPIGIAAMGTDLLPTTSLVSIAVEDTPSALAAPEPSTWILMLAAFGLTGFELRRKREIGRAFIGAGFQNENHRG